MLFMAGVKVKADSIIESRTQQQFLKIQKTVI